MAPKALVAGNWKMNGVKSSVSELKSLIELINGETAPNCDVLLCPPATLIGSFVDVANGKAVHIGAQDCHVNVSGAHTGDISAAMIKDMGGTHIIVGHSERRADHFETSELVRNKAEAAHKQELTAIVCIGETEAQRKAGDTIKVVVEDQLLKSLPENAAPENTIVAYEPVWAIGTGLTPTVEDVAEVHTSIRNALVERFGNEVGNGFAILYGGSVKPGNAKELMSADNVNGALVGGASLKAVDFNGIIDAYR
jgi:triosephosphate isomerase